MGPAMPIRALVFIMQPSADPSLARLFVIHQFLATFALCHTPWPIIAQILNPCFKHVHVFTNTAARNFNPFNSISKEIKIPWNTQKVYLFIRFLYIQRTRCTKTNYWDIVGSRIGLQYLTLHVVKVIYSWSSSPKGYSAEVKISV